MTGFRRQLCFLALLLTSASAGYAQIPGAAQPGQIERQFQKPPEPRSQPGAIRIPEGTQKPPPNAAQIKFTLNRIDITGTTIYPAESLRASFAPLIGKEVTLADVYGVAEKLTARYRNDGYILSQVVVPAQTVDAGIVRLQAIEGHVANIRVEGADAAQTQNILEHANKIKASRPLTSAILERYLLLINDLPGTYARGVLASSRSQQGASDLVIQVTPRIFNAGLSIDNRGSRALGPRRLLADAEVYYPLGMGARTGIKLVTTGNGELSYAALSHDQWLGSEGGKLGLGYSASRSKPELQTIIPLNLQTASDTLSLSYSHPVKRSREENLYVRAALAVQDGETKVFGVRDTEDRLRSIRLGLTYDKADAWAGINTLDVEYSQGFKGMGASKNGDPFLSRPQGRIDYSKATIYAARLQSLGGGWSALGAFNGQYAFSTLLAAELFSFGGEQFGRGYDPSELTGDHGAALKFELRYSGAISGATYTTYGFYDVGQVRQRNPGGLPASTSAASSGLGLRLNLGRHVSGVVEIAKPLTKIVAQENDHKLRFYGGLSLRF
jgi:hemolysin activation/secretion protein